MSSSRLAAILIRLRRRLRLLDGWLLAQRTLWIGLAGSLSAMIAGRLWPIEQLWFWILTPILLWLCANLCFYIIRPQKLMQVAQRVDLALGLKERLSTALELESEVAPQSPALPIYQQRDALTAAQTIELRKAFPLYWLHRPLMAAAGFLVAAIIIAYLPNPMEAVLEEREAVDQAAQEQAENIEDLKEEFEQSSELSPEMQAELLRQLEELAQKLRENPGDRAEALADLSKLEQELRRQLDTNIDLRQASLEAIASQLQSLAEQDNANPPSLSAALEQFADELENMNETERQELAEALAQMAAQAAQVGDQSLAQALAAMSQATLSGDSAAASQAASDASGALAQAQQELSNQQALQQALDQLQNSSQAMAQAGQAGQQAAGQEPGQGNNPGQGQSGQGTSGGGTKADTLPPGTGSGQTGRPEDMDTGGATGEMGEQIFIPWDRRTSESNEVSIPGQDTGQGETITRENPNPSGGLPGDALIPYQQAYTEYLEAAQQAINRSEIPAVYRDLVRDYFTQLEP